MLNLKTVEFFVLLFFFLNSDTEYRKLLSGTYKYEYEEYPDKDNFASNQPQDTTTTTSLGSMKRLQLGQIYLQPVKMSLLKLSILQKCQQQFLT